MRDENTPNEPSPTAAHFKRESSAQRSSLPDGPCERGPATARVTSRVAQPWFWAAIVPGLFVASLLATIGILVALKSVGWVQVPRTRIGEKALTEFFVRLTLLFFIASSYAAVLSSESKRRWLMKQRWRLTVFVLFPLGTAIAMADPFHTIQKEANWIRYVTTAPLVVGGIVAIRSATQVVRPIADRTFGAVFGSMMIAAGADEIFQFHEESGRLASGTLPAGWPLEAQDTITLGLALAGVITFCGAFLLRRSTGVVGRAFRHPRYSAPLRIFGLATVSFFIAMMLDGFDARVVSAWAGILDGYGFREDRFWFSLTEVEPLLNAIEEILEYLTGLFLMTVIGTLFAVRALGGDAEISAC